VTLIGQSHLCLPNDSEAVYKTGIDELSLLRPSARDSQFIENKKALAS
jgi:hypothetical protein